MNAKIKTFFPVIFLLAALLSCSKSDSNTAGSGGTPTAAVSILSMSYSPSTLTVKTGTVVTWTNNGGTVHTVTADNGTSFNSPNISVGNTFALTTTATGSFPYHCLIHGTMMAGTLVVTP